MSRLKFSRKIDSSLPRQTLSIAYTPDSDDVFNFYAWEQGILNLPGYEPIFSRNHIAHLNEDALDAVHDVVAVSSVMFPLLEKHYWILAVGSSVGRGYGPVLVSKKYTTLDSLAGCRIGVAGTHTTGGMLAAMYAPADAQLIERPYDTIAQHILDGNLDAGVMIHEELVHFPKLGLQRVCDLGKTWCDDTQLPLPVGLSLVKKSLGRQVAVDIARICRDSLLWGLEHPDEAMGYANGFGRGCSDTFVPMFSNTDTLNLPGDVRRGLRVLFDRLASEKRMPELTSYDIIDP